MAGRSIACVRINKNSIYRFSKGGSVMFPCVLYFNSPFSGPQVFCPVSLPPSFACTSTTNFGFAQFGLMILAYACLSLSFSRHSVTTWPRSLHASEPQSRLGLSPSTFFPRFQYLRSRISVSLVLNSTFNVFPSAVVHWCIYK